MGFRRHFWIGVLGLFALAAAASHAQAQIQRGEPLKRGGFLGVQSAPDEGGKGAKVVRLIPGGTGEDLKLLVGDVIEKVNGASVATPQQLALSVRGLRAGDALNVSVLRDGKPTTLSGKLAGRPMQTETDLEVIYDQVVSKGNRIRVIITKPKGSGPFPTFFYIGGIGAYSLDGAFSALHPAMGGVLGAVAKAGYVTVRIDKPGQGDSEGPVYKDLAFGDEQDAYLQALRLAKSLPYVAKDRIAIFGHSMGGTFGPLVAEVEPVKALIVTGTLYKTFGEYMLENTRRQAELGGASGDDVDRSGRDTFKATHYLFNEGLSPKEMVQKHPEMAAWLRENSPDGETYSGVGFPFFRELSQINLGKSWANQSADVLAIYCANDFLSGQSDHESIAAAANKHRAESGEFKLLTDADHLFKKTTSMLDSMQKWSQPGGEFNSAIVDTLLEYLKRKLG